MHSENASICASVAADGFWDLGLPPGRNLPHTFWAAWNDGDAGLTPEPMLMLMWMPPAPREVVGSGKFGTPCERMHDVNLIADAISAAATFEVLLLGLLDLLEDPQPAITSRPDVTATAIAARWRAGRNGTAFPANPRLPR